MQHWNIRDIRAPDGSRSPQVLHSQDGQARVVAIHLQPGQELGDHQVKEATLLLVVEGQVRVGAGATSIDGTAGMLFRFEPEERRTVAADREARVVLVLAPWPGEGHYYADERRGAGVSASSPDAV